MFEKEAEEYTSNILKDVNCTIGNPRARQINSIDVECAYKDGAEFGYNKAKEEWKKHFLQCSSPFCLDIFSSVKCYGELGNMAKKEGEEK